MDVKRGTNSWGFIYIVGVILLLALKGGASYETQTEWLIQGVAGCALVGILITQPRLLSDPNLRPVWVLYLCLGFWIILQIIPLPYDLWTALSGRETIQSEISLLEIDEQAIALSYSPLKSLGGLVSFLLPLSVLTGTMWLTKTQIGFVTALWIVVALLSAGLGLVQVIVPGGGNLYLWERVNAGLPVGLFANINHHAALIYGVLPFVLLWGSGNISVPRLDGARQVGSAAVLLFLAVFIVLTGSRAGIGLFGLAGLLGVVAIIAWHSRRRGYVGIVFLVCLLCLVLGLAVFSGLGPNWMSSELSSDLSRTDMTRKGLEMWRDHWLAGIGMGSTEFVYSIYETPEQVGRTYVNHLHNDVLQWLIELGVVGAALLAGFGVWLLRILKKAPKTAVFRSPLMAMACIVLLCLFVHSWVDYPFRTPLLAAFGAFNLGLVLRSVEDFKAECV